MLIVSGGGVVVTGVLVLMRIVGMSRVFARVLLVMPFVMRVFLGVCGRRLGRESLDRRRGRHAGMGFFYRCFARSMLVMVIVMTMRFVIVRLVAVMIRIAVMVVGVVRGCFSVCAFMYAVAYAIIFLALIGLGGLRGIAAGIRNDVALDTVAMAAPARSAMTRATATAAGAVFAFFLGLAMGAFVGLDQRLTVGDRDLVIVGMDFAEGQEAVAVAAIFDEGRLQRRLYARDLGEVDIAAQLFALGGLEIKFFDAIAADHNDPGLFRVGGIDQHLVGHFGTLDGGGRGAWRAHIARPGDATVHLIRG